MLYEFPDKKIMQDRIAEEQVTCPGEAPKLNFV